MSLRRALVPLSILLAATGALSAPAPSASAASPAAGPAASPAASAVDATAQATTVTIAGFGNGHGKGLSQYGARNRAAAGQGYAAIAKHYYPGTRWGKATGALRIKITADVGKDVNVVARPGLTVKALGTGRVFKLAQRVHHSSVSRWRIMPSGRDSELQFRAAGSWHPWRTVAGNAQFGGSRPITLVTPQGRATYRGALRSVATNAAGTRRDTVNVVPVEAYLRGVVAREVPAGWPQPAVRAQAVAARTYAAFERRAAAGRHYDLCDTSHCQVYGGVAAEHPRSDAAVKATAKRVLTYGGRPAFTQFSASNGGWSVRGSMPYLRAAQDTYDRGVPGDPWRVTFRAAQITRHWPGLGELRSVKVVTRDGHGRFGGRATSVRVTGSESAVTVAGSTFASYLGLRSTLFRIG